MNTDTVTIVCTNCGFSYKITRDRATRTKINECACHECAHITLRYSDLFGIGYCMTCEYFKRDLPWISTNHGECKRKDKRTWEFTSDNNCWVESEKIKKLRTDKQKPKEQQPTIKEIFG